MKNTTTNSRQQTGTPQMKKYYRSARAVVAVLTMSVLLQGCGVLSGSPLVQPNTKYRIPLMQVDPGVISQYTQFLAEQIARNRDTYNISNNPIAITSFVNLENLKRTNKLGELLADNMIHEMQIRGFRITDFKSMPAIQVSRTGDFIRSREAQELRNEHNINLVLSGTYTNHQEGTIVNARMINIANGMVVSTAQTNIPREIAEAIFGSYHPEEASNAEQSSNAHQQRVVAKKKRAYMKRQSNRVCLDNGVCLRGR